MTSAEYIGHYITAALINSASKRQEIVIFDGEDKYKVIVDNYCVIGNEDVPTEVLTKEIGKPIISSAIRRVTLITKQA